MIFTVNICRIHRGNLITQSCLIYYRLSYGINCCKQLVYDLIAQILTNHVVYNLCLVTKLCQYGIIQCDDLAACILTGLLVLSNALICAVIAILSCCLCAGIYQFSYIIRQSVVKVRVHIEGNDMTQMIGLYHVLLNLLNIVANNVHVRVFLTVNGALLKSHKYLGKLHRGCCCAYCIPISNVILIGHNADLLTL